MNAIIRQKLNRIKDKLTVMPDSILVGSIGESLSDAQEVAGEIEMYTQYIDFIRDFNGATLGEIEIFPLEEAERNQFYVDHLIGGRTNWRFIGNILYEPLVINKNDGNVYRIYRDFDEDHPTESFGCFDEFLMNYALGKKYSSIIPFDSEDQWAKLINTID
ncbi:hypothetical protein [Paenibacillus xylanexedens]|uniref:hypothetical protein n=1 Tax=Paenibacillus xylanexedens TaxID=528191 RepID=UPI0011A5D9D3|nr:hypothetical protein [Paenibacillus xylanexedens]